MSETKKQQECIYCHGDSELIMSETFGGADVYVSGNMLKVYAIYTRGALINYCPMCGRKLVEAQHDTRTD